MEKVRKIPIKSRSSAGSFYSVKNNRRVEFESQVEQPIEIESIYNK